MELLRELAERRARGRASSPTRPRTCALCDKVVVMGRGGELTLSTARPTTRSAFFGVDDFDGIYDALDERPASEWRREFEAGAGDRRTAPRADAGAPPRAHGDGAPAHAAARVAPAGARAHRAAT